MRRNTFGGGGKESRKKKKKTKNTKTGKAIFNTLGKPCVQTKVTHGRSRKAESYWGEPEKKKTKKKVIGSTQIDEWKCL